MKLFDLHHREVPARKRNYSADEPMHPLQIRAYRRMSPAEKLDRMADLYQCACAFHEAGIRMRHPEWTDEEVRRELRESILYGVS